MEYPDIYANLYLCKRNEQDTIYKETFRPLYEHYNQFTKLLTNFISFTSVR